jgi:hypothetical protein
MEKKIDEIFFGVFGVMVKIEVENRREPLLKQLSNLIGFLFFQGENRRVFLDVFGCWNLWEFDVG